MYNKQQTKEESINNYLTEIYKLTEEGENQVKTSQIAKSMDVKPASVTEQVKKLEKQDLVCRAPYKGFTLSPMGKQKAQDLVQKQQTVQKFLDQHLKVKKAEQQAQKITPRLTDETIESMKRKID